MERSRRQACIHRASAVRHRAQSERGLNALGVKFTYVQVDLATAGSQLESGSIDALTITRARKARRRRGSPKLPWRPTGRCSIQAPRRLAELKKQGFAIAEVRPKAFNRDVHADKVIELPFYYGFNVGLDVSEADVYSMLTIIEKNAGELAKTDPTFTQIANDMKGFQVRGVKSSVDLVLIHPGLAKWMREKGVWNAKWDSKVAKN